MDMGLMVVGIEPETMCLFHTFRHWSLSCP
uniref:Uncharacterized protein n=1 Tax=Vitis vinifera TaxID=29760 RepID=F6HYD0_VITVI